MSDDNLIRLAGRGGRGRGRGATHRKVFLVDFYWTRNKDPRVPLGHASLLAALRHARIEVESLAIAVNGGVDADTVADQIVADCRGASPADVDVAIGAYVWAEAQVRSLLGGLRARGFRGRIILGGPQISYAGPGLEALYPEADAFVRGYGEEAIVELARAPGRTPIVGVHHAGDHDRAAQAAVDLEALPSPWLDGVVPLADQAFIRWETQRGCPFRCSFCQHREPGMRLVHHELSRSRVLAEVDLFCRAGVREIAVLDPIFNQGAWATTVLERFATHGFGGRLALQCRAEMIDDAFLAAARGLDVCLELGLQTIHLDESKAVERGNNLPRVDQALAKLRDAGLDHEVSLIFGLPGQTLASFIASVRWCLERGVPTLKAFPLLLLRGTKLERTRAQWGYQDDGAPMAMVRASNTFTRADWDAMSRIAEVLRTTERRHPSTIDEVLARAADVTPELNNWQAAQAAGGDSCSSIDLRPMFVAFEGLDGAGKTTAARMTAEALGAELMTTPTPRVRLYRDELIASFAGCQEAAQLFYLATVFAASDEIRAKLAAGHSVVLDRYFLSTQAYAAFRGSALDVDHLGDLLVPADLTVFVHAPLATRLERLAQRGATAADRETMATAADARLRAEHEQRLGLPVVGRALRLDSSVESPEALVTSVLAELRALGRPRRE